MTRGDIRRLARRGGVKRISANIYDEVRNVMRMFLEDVCGFQCFSRVCSADGLRVDPQGHLRTHRSLRAQDGMHARRRVCIAQERQDDLRRRWTFKSHIGQADHPRVSTIQSD